MGTILTEEEVELPLGLNIKTFKEE